MGLRRAKYAFPVTYIDTIPNYQGADSIITFSLTFHSLDIGVIQDQSAFVRSGEGILKCGNNDHGDRWCY
jgi:hypothetical protein